MKNEIARELSAILYKEYGGSSKRSFQLARSLVKLVLLQGDKMKNKWCPSCDVDVLYEKCETCDSSLNIERGLVSWSEHTVQEDFEHFMSYSGMLQEEQSVKDKLFIAYEAAWRSGRPTPRALDWAYCEHCKSNTVYDGCCITCMRPPSPRQ